MRLYPLINGKPGRRDRTLLLSPPFDNWVSRACIRVYRGVGTADAIDYALPVATLAGDADSCKLTGLGHAPCGDYWYAARRANSAGFEETNKHVVACLRLDEHGQAVPVLNAPRHLAVQRTPNGKYLLRFTYLQSPGFAQPECFEVLAGAGSGHFDESSVITTAVARPRQREYAVVLALVTLPQELTVRARLGTHTGPLGQPVTVAASNPIAPVIFQLPI